MLPSVVALCRCRSTTVVINPPFPGETERTIPWSRPAVSSAGSKGRVKGAKRDRSHAQRSEHGEDRPFDAPERPARMDTTEPDWVAFRFRSMVAFQSLPKLPDGSASDCNARSAHLPDWLPFLRERPRPLLAVLRL